MINRIVIAAAALALFATAASPADNDQDHHRVVRRTVVVHKTVVRGWAPRSDFRNGGRVGEGDWRRGRVVDYRVKHLRAPPRGYEWREIDGRYVLAAVATGLIADMILNAH